MDDIAREGDTLAFEPALEQRQILPIGAAHRHGHERSQQLRESGRRSSIPKRHARLAVGNRFPCIGRLHWKRAFGGAHDEPLFGGEFDDLVRVREAPAEETCNKGDPRTNLEGARRFPLDRFDVDVPVRRLSGLAAYSATSRAGLSMTAFVDTSTMTDRDGLLLRAHRRSSVIV